MSGQSIRVETIAEGALLRVVLARPKANILDRSMMEALTTAFDRAGETAEVRAVLLDADGPHFSFGASVQEHTRESAPAMLGAFHALFRAIDAASLPVLAAVRGQCLGGALELASFCHRVFAAPDARLGQPEIVLGVFAPVAALVLPERMGRGAAEDLCLSGRAIDAAEALRLGLVDQMADDPGAAALAYAQSHLVPRSAASLRHAVRALRRPFTARFFEQLEILERRYLDELMTTADANEGIAAFLAKRPPSWSNR